MKAAAPVAAVVVVAAVWMAAAPGVADLSTHAYRAWLWRTEGFTVFDFRWYGGHHVPGYSLLFPPLGGWLGARAAVAVAGVAAAATLVALGRELAPDRAAVGWLLASAAASNLVTGRGPFALGVAMAAGALLLASRRRLAPAALLSLLTAAASPVAALFLGLAALVWAWPRDARLLAALAGPATVLTGLTVLLFPEGGSQPFSAASFWPMLLLTAVAAALLPGRWRAAAVLTGLLLVAAFAIPTPLGSNALRLAPLAGPAVLLAAGRGPRPLVLLAVAGLLYLQLQTAERAVLDARGDPATHARFYTPLLGFLDGAARPGDRVEVAFTRTHWETAFVAERHPIARGWERQLDRRVNPLFYDSKPLTAARYEAWLRAEGIRWVALADAPLDFSARQEAKLLERGQPFLRAAFAGPGWRAWELRGPPRPVEGAATITGEGPTEIRLRVDRPGRVLVRRRHSPYLTITGGCVTEAAGGWIELRMRRPGTAVIGSSLTGRGPECGP